MRIADSEQVHTAGAKTGNMLVRCWKATEHFGGQDSKDCVSMQYTVLARTVTSLVVVVVAEGLEMAVVRVAACMVVVSVVALVLVLVVVVVVAVPLS